MHEINFVAAFPSLCLSEYQVTSIWTLRTLAK
jgi:hypothetical protein